MTHFGIISPPVSGHLNPLSALARELKQRGHQITFFQIPDVEAKILAEGLNFHPIGESDHPLGTLKKSVHQLATFQGLTALSFAIKLIQKTTNMICRDAPEAVKAEGIEVLLIDQTEPAGATVAEYLELPFINICCAMAINREANIPPLFTSWSYRRTWWARWRNQLGYFIFDRITQPVQTTLTQYRQKWNLSPYRSVNDSFSPLAQISQQLAEFDFPRQTLPSNFYYVGPLRDSFPQSVSFPYDKLTGQPLIYASLGTQQNTKIEIFTQIAAACADLDVQLVIAHGGGMSQEQEQKLPGSPLAVNYAPQYELLAKASLTITHAGLNTVLDSLSHGVPLITIPITYEQPAIAARLHWVGAGEILSLKYFSASKLKTIIKQVLRNDIYQEKAHKIQKAILQAGGVKKAADIIEQKISKYDCLSNNSTIN